MGHVLQKRHDSDPPSGLLGDIVHAQSELLLPEVQSAGVIGSLDPVSQAELPQKEEEGEGSREVAGCPPLCVPCQRKKEELDEFIHRRRMPSNSPLTPH